MSRLINAAVNIIEKWLFLYTFPFPRDILY